MAASKWRNWLWWAIVAPCVVGCQGLFGTQGPPRDPLFFSKTPISATPELTPPIAFAYLEPTVPRDPFLVKNPATFADKNGGTVPGVLTNRANGED